MKRLSLFAAVALPLGALTLAARSPSDDDTAIRAAVQHYFDGMMEASPDHLRLAFHPEARLIGPGRDGNALIIPFEQWAKGWEGRETRDPKTHSNRVVSVDVSGSAAMAKTELVWPNVTYVDYLSLLKLNGEWKVVNKIWTEERR